MLKKITPFLLNNLGYYFFKCLHLTCRFEHIHPSGQRCKVPFQLSGAYLLSAWHEHVIMIIMSQKGVPFHPIVSRSSHGEFVGHVCKKFGYSPIYGSQDRDGRDKGGTSALFGLLKALKKGFPVAITVDGSIGPRRYVKQGIIDLSRKTGAAIVPVACYSSSYWELNSWDRLKIPKPFAKITIHYGNAVHIPDTTAASEFESLQQSIGNKMDQLEEFIRLK